MKAIGGGVLSLYKRLGETPRERLERLRLEKPQYQYEVLSYAGRLDPMAEGVLLCLVGAENSRHEKWLELSKEYVLDILFGFATDTYDILGKVIQTGDSSLIGRRSLEQGLNEFRGLVSQEYPPFSSKTLDGRALFEWAREGSIGSLTIPRRTVTIYDIEFSGMYKIPEPQLLFYIESSIARVQGDFRQEEILELWHRNLRPAGTREFPCATIKISCSSGTYARSIAHGLGQHLGIPALALHILRTKVGEYSVAKSLR
ncbi:MAG: hypothetical protein KGJ34_00240 [Patescibacteria group bacterium]|nr:hypothetical protein [Patescibacteria group bacterium]